LLAQARQGTNEFQDLLFRYALERLLYRLSVSKYRDRFVLKGAMLFSVWAAVPHRTTRDLDLLGFDPPDPRAYEDVFRQLCTMKVVPDGLVYLADSVHAERIREEDEYQGIRVRLDALLDKARITVQADIGTGDAAVPAPEEIEYPTLLDFPAPRIKAYSRYAVVAEKLQTMVSLGLLNSRMRDFYDIFMLSRQFEFDGELLGAAASATFERRRTRIPSTSPDALGSGFAGDADKQRQWRTYLTKTRLTGAPEDLGLVIAALGDFLMPVLSALAQGRVLGQLWKPGAGWQAR
jgi:predicted nucleotidyltransferase component of viral defense system